MRRGAAGVVAVLAAAGGAACGGAERAPSDAAPPAAAAPSAAAAGAAPGGAATAHGACPHDGRWRPCSVAERLEQAGLAPRPDTAARPPVPFFSAPDTALRVALGTVRAFVYADTARLARDVAALDPVRVAPRDGPGLDWPVRPTLVRSANLVAVILVTNERQLERVQLALEAGPPARNPDRP